MLNYLFSFIGSLAIIAFQSIVMSAFFALCKWLLSLLGICNVSTWVDFIAGAIGLFVLLFIYAGVKTAITMYRYHKDPVFKDANMKIGIGWKDYKRFMKK